MWKKVLLRHNWPASRWLVRRGTSLIYDDDMAMWARWVRNREAYSRGN